jgi:DNA-binding transcriptional ArsR family regulator
MENSENISISSHAFKELLIALPEPKKREIVELLVRSSNPSPSSTSLQTLQNPAIQNQHEPPEVIQKKRRSTYTMEEKRDALREYLMSKNFHKASRTMSLSQ